MDPVFAFFACLLFVISTSTPRTDTAPVPKPPTVEQMYEVTRTAKVQVDIKTTELGEEINIKVNK